MDVGSKENVVKFEKQALPILKDVLDHSEVGLVELEQSIPLSQVVVIAHTFVIAKPAFFFFFNLTFPLLFPALSLALLNDVRSDLLLCQLLLFENFVCCLFKQVMPKVIGGHLQS